MRLTQKLAIGATGLGGLAIGSLGLGVAHAQSASTSVPAVSTPAAGPVTTQAEAPDAPTIGASADAPGGHQDPPGANVQFGSQSGPDTGGVDTAANN